MGYNEHSRGNYLAVVRENVISDAELLTCTPI